MKARLFLAAAGVCGLLFSLVPDASAASYYVAPGGSDSGSGAIGTPWGTLAKAAKSAAAGDTVYLRAGTYPEALHLQTSGSPGNPILFTAYPGEQPVLDGTSVSTGSEAGLVMIDNASYVTVNGLTVQNFDSIGIWVLSGNHVSVTNNIIRNVGNSGIYSEDIESRAQYVAGDEDLVIAGNDLDETNTAGDNEAMSITSTYNFIIRDNILRLTHKEGIDVKDGTSHGRVAHNTILAGDPNYDGAGIYVDARDLVAEDIEVSANFVNGRPSGITMDAEEGGTVRNVGVYNNLVLNAKAGIEIAACNVGGPRQQISIINNTIVGPVPPGDWGLGITADPTNQYDNNIILRNNLCAGSVTQIDVPAVVVVDHNLFFGATATTGTNSVVGDPLFVDPNNGDYRLKAGSPAIDHGSSTGAPASDYDGHPRPQGSGFDMGAFEFGALAGSDAGPVSVGDVGFVSGSDASASDAQTSADAAEEGQDARAGRDASSRDARSSADSAEEGEDTGVGVGSDASASDASTSGTDAGGPVDAGQAGLGPVDSGCGCRMTGTEPALLIALFALMSLMREKRRASPARRA